MGKTPFVEMLAKKFSHRKVAILSRGYGVVPDEPMMLAKKLPNVKIYIGKDRVASAEQAEMDGAELIILDDGMQHRRLFRDVEIVLHDFENQHFLPRGMLRDSKSRLSKADFVLERGKDVQVVPVSPPDIRGQKVGIFCGIARPEQFKKMVVDLGAEVVAEWFLADHQLADPSIFAKKCKELGASALICTEKDFIKLPKNSYALPVLCLEIEMVGSVEKLIEKIEEKIDNIV
jgi:tetraacyldisaccharide 4'-kinase